MNPEQATIHAFIARPRQGLYLALQSNPDDRRRFLERLLSGRDLDPSAIVQIPDDDRDPEQIADRLRKLGAPESCHVIGGGKLDGREAALTDVVGDAAAAKQGMIVSCVAGRLALFAGADEQRFVLRSAGSGRKSGRD